MKAFQERLSSLEQRAVDLESKRRENFANLENRRQEASTAADIQLNIVLANLLRENEATYILNQQSALVWPDSANMTEIAIDRLNQRLPSVGFKVNLDEADIESEEK